MKICLCVAAAPGHMNVKALFMQPDLSVLVGRKLRSKRSACWRRFWGSSRSARAPIPGMLCYLLALFLLEEPQDLLQLREGLHSGPALLTRLQSHQPPTLSCQAITGTSSCRIGSLPCSRDVLAVRHLSRSTIMLCRQWCRQSLVWWRAP